MSIKIVMPVMAEQLLDRVIREMHAHYPVIDRFGTHLRPGDLQKFELIQLYSYDVERMCEHDIILTFEREAQIQRICPVPEPEKLNIESMLNPVVPPDVIEAKVPYPFTGIYPVLLMAICKHLGVAVPEGYKFETSLADYMSVEPYVPTKYRNLK